MFRITVISATAPLAVRVHCVEPAYHPSTCARPCQLVPPRGPPDVEAMTSPGGGGGRALRRPHLPAAAAASMRPLRLCVLFTARRLPPFVAPSVVACCCVAACCCPPTLRRRRRHRSLPPAPPPLLQLRPGLVVCERLPSLGVAAPRARVEVRLGGTALPLGLQRRGLPGLPPHLMQRDGQHRATSANNAPQLSQRASSPRQRTAPYLQRHATVHLRDEAAGLLAQRRPPQLAPGALRAHRRATAADDVRRTSAPSPQKKATQGALHGRHAAAGGRQAQQRACGESGCGGGGGGGGGDTSALRRGRAQGRRRTSRCPRADAAA
jgi:hypothetical protein